jgi:hypothetical protein
MCEIWGPPIGVENGLPSCYSGSSEVAYEFVGPLLKDVAVLDLIVVTVLTTWSPAATERCWCRLMTPCGVLALSPGRKWHRRIGKLHLKEFETLFSVCHTSWNPVLEFSHFCNFHMLVLYSTAGRHDSTYVPLLATKNFFVPCFDRLPLRVYECA